MPLDRLEIIRIVTSLKFPVDQYSLLMGAALVLHGVKEFANDIDLGCSVKLFDMILNGGYNISVSRSGYQKIDISDTVAMYKEWMPSKIALIDGIPVSALQSIISDKKRYSRPKDIEDIALIKDFVARGGMPHD